MFSFMKKDKEKEREHKREKEERKKEKKEKKDKEKKQREHITQEELNRLDEIKRGVFKRNSKIEKKKAEGWSSPDDDGGFLQRDSDSSTSISSSDRLSPGRDVHDSGSSGDTALGMPRHPPPTLPKPKSILKSKGQQPAVPHQGLDDTAILKSNTAYNVEMSAYPVDDKGPKPRSGRSGSKSSIKDRPPEFTPPPPPDTPPPEKAFKAALKLPDIVPSKPPRVRELLINRTKAGDFGFTLRKGNITQKGSDGTEKKHTVIFAEPGASQSSSQTGLIPGDRLIEVNGVNTENKPREEIIELIRATGDSVTLKVQPIPELVELSVRPAIDGSLVDIQDDMVKGGTLKRSGSLRYKKSPVSASVQTCKGLNVL